MNEKEIILKMISDGKITAEEGAELLEEIEKSKRDYERSKRNETGSSFGENLRKELNSYSESISEREIPEKIIGVISPNRTVNVNSTYEEEFEDIDKIIIEVTDSKILITGTDSEKVKLKIRSDKFFKEDELEKYFTLDEEGGLLKLTQKKNKKTSEFLGIKFQGLTLGKSICEISIPKDKYFEFISARSAVGDIEVSSALSQKVNVVASAGRVKIKDIDCSIADLSSNASSVTIENSSVNDYASLSTMAGSVYIENTISPTVKADTKAGSVSVTNSDIKELVATTFAGSIDVSRIIGEPISYTLTTTTGSVNLDTANIENVKAFCTSNKFFSSIKCSKNYRSGSGDENEAVYVKGNEIGLNVHLATQMGKINIM